jgi:hypothetical protein
MMKYCLSGSIRVGHSFPQAAAFALPAVMKILPFGQLRQAIYFAKFAVMKILPFGQRPEVPHGTTLHAAGKVLPLRDISV